jgi:hypothetical protein
VSVAVGWRDSCAGRLYCLHRLQYSSTGHACSDLRVLHRATAILSHVPWLPVSLRLSVPVQLQ